MRVTSPDPVPMSMRPLRTVLCSSVLVKVQQEWAALACVPSASMRSQSVAAGAAGWVGGVMGQDAP